MASASLPEMRAVQALGAAYFTILPDTARVCWAMLLGRTGKLTIVVTGVPKDLTGRIRASKTANIDLGCSQFCYKAYTIGRSGVVSSWQTCQWIRRKSACMAFLAASKTGGWWQMC